MSNSEHLLSPEWSTIKACIIKRAGGCCEYCWEEKPELVHRRIAHRPWSTHEAPDFRDLMALCSPCHEYIHDRGERPQCSPSSPLGLGVSGFVQRETDDPGAWYRFRQSKFSWFACHPETGVYRYDPANQPKGSNSIEGVVTISRVEEGGEFLSNRNSAQHNFVGTTASSESEPEKMTERHWSYLMEKSVLPNVSLSMLSETSIYEGSCYSCKSDVFSSVHPECCLCGWTTCGTCAACGCGFHSNMDFSSFTAKDFILEVHRRLELVFAKGVRKAPIPGRSLNSPEAINLFLQQ